MSADAPPAISDAGPTVIRVINVQRALTDLSTVGSEELLQVLGALAAAPELKGVRLRPFAELADTLQGSTAPFLAPLDPLETIQARILLTNPAVRAILGPGGPSAKGKAAGPGKTATAFIHTRPSCRVRAFRGGRLVAVAEEEPIDIVGFAVSLDIAGAVLEPTVYPLTQIATSGAFSASRLLAAAGFEGAMPPEAPEAPAAEATARRIPRHQVFGVEALPVLLAHTRAAVLWGQSGAAVAAAYARLCAGIDDLPGAPAALLALFHPLESILANSESTPGPTWRAPADAERLAWFMKRLAKNEPIYGVDAAAWDLAPLFDMYRVGAQGMYLYALTEGRESAHLENFFELSAIRAIKEAQMRAILAKATQASNRARLFVLIIEDKFGTARMAEVTAGLQFGRASGAPGGIYAQVSAQYDNPDQVMSLLTKREREVVETEYANRQRAWQAAADNKCPHVRIMRRLRLAPTAEKAFAALHELAPYISKQGAKKPKAAGAPADWISCTSCGHRLVCPHVLERYALEEKGAPYDAIRTAMTRYSVRIPSGESHAFFCKICSEKLADSDYDGETDRPKGRYGDLDSGLRSKIWGIALNAVPFIKFSVPTDERVFAGNVADVVFPLLMAAEDALGKKRVRKAKIDNPDEDEIDPRTHLYAIIFVYAFILDLVDSAPPQTPIGFEGVKPGAKPGAYADRILRHIADKHNSIIVQIEDLTAEYMKQRFVEAYRMVKGSASSALEKINPEAELAVQTLTVDTVFRYGTSMARIAGDLPKGRPANPAELRRVFECVLGEGLPDIIKKARENAKDPALAPLFQRRTGVEVPQGGSIEFLLKGPRVNLYANLYQPKSTPKAAVAAFRDYAASYGGGSILCEVVGGRAAPRPASKPQPAPKPKPATKRPALKIKRESSLIQDGYVYESYRLFRSYICDVVTQELYEQFQEDLAIVLRAEAGMLFQQHLGRLPPSYDFGHQTTQQTVVNDDPNIITRLYDEDGVRHAWSVYVFADGGEEIIVKGPVSAAGLSATARLVDRECKVCGIRQSRTATLDPAKTWESVTLTANLASFFSFYETRCPEGDLHEWGADPPCKKCGLAAGKKPRAYYDKYAAQFRAKRHEVVKYQASEPVPEPEGAPEATLVAWSPDYTRITAVAEMGGIPPAVIEAIGAMEGRDYKDIAEGAGIPAPPTTAADPRIYAVDAEIRRLMRNVSALRHYGRHPKPSPADTDLLEKAKYPAHEHKALPQVIPAIGEGYAARLAAIAETHTPEAVLTFVLQTLCEYILALAALPTPLGNLLAMRELKGILRGQELLSKPGAFNWAIFEGEEDTPEQAGDVGEDVLEEILLADAMGEEAAADPFSGAEVDYDFSENNPNNEPS